KFCLLTMLTLAAVLPAQAQLSGPIIRDLGNHYYLVQCNLQQLQPDQQIDVVRNGLTIAQGKVMRSQAGACTILVTSGEVRRFDTVVLPVQAGAVSNDRGPAIPTYGCVSAPVVARPTPTQAPATFWNTLQSNGRVYNLNTGETLSP
ncbi:MAG: hypothetical protein U0931_42195, partial [Vulcanimicrobiota bacterium]